MPTHLLRLLHLQAFRPSPDSGSSGYGTRKISMRMAGTDPPSAQPPVLRACKLQGSLEQSTSDSLQDGGRLRNTSEWRWDRYPVSPYWRLCASAGARGAGGAGTGMREMLNFLTIHHRRYTLDRNWRFQGRPACNPGHGCLSISPRPDLCPDQRTFLITITPGSWICWQIPSNLAQSESMGVTQGNPDWSMCSTRTGDGFLRTEVASVQDSWRWRTTRLLTLQAGAFFKGTSE